MRLSISFEPPQVSLTQNCQPPQRSSRAAQMRTIFIFLLFFPFFVGALSVVAYTAWTLNPSEQCGPFRGLNSTFAVVEVWMTDLEGLSDSQWAIWIYQNVIRSELFYFLVTLIIIVIIYIFWQVTKGRQELIRLLRQQIINEGKDKSFLLDKLQNLQKSHPNRNPKQKKQKEHTKRRSGSHSSSSHSNSNAMVQALLARRQFEEEGDRHNTEGVPVPSDISTSSAVMQAMLARQRAEREQDDLYHMPDENSSSSDALVQAFAARQTAEAQERDEYYGAASFSENPVSGSSAVMQAMEARQRAEAERGHDMDDLTSPVSSVMMQVMQARQRAEEEDRIQWVPAPPQSATPPGSSALIQAMLARQQAQNEYDDGY